MHIMNLRASRAHTHMAAGQACRILWRSHTYHTFRIRRRIDPIDLLCLNLTPVHEELLLQDLRPVTVAGAGAASATATATASAALLSLLAVGLLLLRIGTIGTIGTASPLERSVGTL